MTLPPEDEAIWVMAEQGLREYEASVARDEEPYRFTTAEAFMAWLDEHRG